MNWRRFSIIAGSLTVAAGAALTAQLLLLSATPSSGPLAASNLRRHGLSTAPAVPRGGEGPSVTASSAAASPVLIREDGTRVAMPPALPEDAVSSGEPASITRADGSVAQIFQVTLADGTFGTREKITDTDGSVTTTDWDAQGMIVNSGSVITSSLTIACGFKPPAAPVLPVVSQEPSPGSVLLTPGQAAAAEQVQDQFIADSGSGSADPATPAYLNRWHHSQSLADQRLRAAIGGQAFARWQMEAYLREHVPPVTESR